MNAQPLENAIKNDLKTLSNMKFGVVPGQDFYRTIFRITMKLSLILFTINMSLRLLFIWIGAQLISSGQLLMLTLGTWCVCFMTALLLSFIFSRFILLGKLIKGRLETAELFKETFQRLGLICLGIYAGVHAIIGAIVSAAFYSEAIDPWFFVFLVLFSQGIAFILSTSITGFMAHLELDRMGLGALFNLLCDLIKKRNQTSETSTEGHGL